MTLRHIATLGARTAFLATSCILFSSCEEPEGDLWSTRGIAFGVVTRPDGQPAANVRVQVDWAFVWRCDSVPVYGSSTDGTRTDAAGRYRIEVGYPNFEGERCVQATAKEQEGPVLGRSSIGRVTLVRLVTSTTPLDSVRLDVVLEVSPQGTQLGRRIPATESRR